MGVRTIFLLVPLLGGAVAHARKPADGCERIKPAQQLSTESSEALDAMIRVGVTGLGRGEGSVESTASVSYDTQLLESDDLARAWYTYQLCVLRETQAITPDMHEALMRKAWGLAPASTATGSPAPAGEPAPVAVASPVGGAAIAGTSSLTFLPTDGVATVVLAQCPVKGRLGTPKPQGMLTWRINGDKHVTTTDSGGAVDVPPGRVALQADYRYFTVRAGTSREAVVEAGKVHYFAVDYTLKMGNVTELDLRPVGPVEGEEILARCTKSRRL